MGILALLQLGCGENTPFEFEPQVVVFSLFVAGHKNPSIKLEQSWQIDRELPEEGLGVTDAQVTVTTDEDTVYYAPVEGSPGLWAPMDSIEVFPLKTYRLDVVIDSEKIYGEATVPDTFGITQPEAGDTLYRDRAPLLIWRRSQGAMGYLIDISSLADTTHVTGIVSAADTIFPILSFFLADSGKHTLKVAALDRNYYDYMWMTGPPGTGEEGETHIEGGLGVFGACVVDSVQVYAQ